MRFGHPRVGIRIFISLGTHTFQRSGYAVFHVVMIFWIHVIYDLADSIIWRFGPSAS